MSSSSHDRLKQVVAFAVLGAVVSVMTALAVPAYAAETFFQPRIQARAEQNTNRNLSTDSNDEDDIVGYLVDLEGTWRRVTPTRDTSIRPRLRFQRYPDRKEIQRTEQFLDIRTRNQVTERTGWDLAGSYSRRDAFNADLGAAEFDDLDPDDLDPQDPATGGDSVDNLVDDTRTFFRISPGFSHQYTELTGIDISAAYENVRYDSDVRTDRSDYDYIQVNLEGTRRLDPRTVVSIGPYAARYETKDDFNVTDSYGLAAGWARQWSERHSNIVRVYGERSEIELTDVTVSDETENNFGGELAGIYRTETGRVRYSLGRRFEPTSAGNRSVTDEVRLQYDWNYSQRMAIRTAVRAFQREAQGDASGGNEREQLRAELGLTWMITPTYFIGGGYEYTWQEREQDTSSAENHALYINFGYRGLVPRR